MSRGHDFWQRLGWGANQETSRAIFEVFAEAGGNFIDTANEHGIKFYE